MTNFYQEIPKIELHAHLSGSVSRDTILDITKDQQHTAAKLAVIEKDDKRTLEECFAVFKVLHDTITSAKIVQRVTVDVIEEFASDGVIYLELRTTIRSLPTYHSYLDAVLQGIATSPSVVHGQIDVRLLLSIDRARGPKEAQIVMDLLTDYSQPWSGSIVGIELSGNPAVGNLLGFADALNSVQAAGLKTSVHLAELPNEGDQWWEFLQSHTPDRIGHGTYLPTPDTLSDGTAAFKARDLILRKRIPLGEFEKSASHQT